MTETNPASPCCEKCKCPPDCDQPGPHCRIITNGKPACHCHTPSPEVQGWERELLDIVMDMRTSRYGKLKTFISNLLSRAYENGRKEWENVNKQYLSRDEAYQRGRKKEREAVVKMVEGMHRKMAQGALVEGTNEYDDRWIDVGWNNALSVLEASLKSEGEQK